MLATEREPEGQPRRARGDDEASVARSAARGAIGIITRPNIAKRSNAAANEYKRMLLALFEDRSYSYSLAPRRARLRRRRRGVNIVRPPSGVALVFDQRPTQQPAPFTPHS